MSKLGGSTVLVTGGLGFIGSHLVRRLLAEKCDVHILGKGTTHNVSDILGSVDLHFGDITDYKCVSSLLAEVRPSRIFHLAALVDASRKANLPEMMRLNFTGTVNLLLASEKFGYDCFVNTGASEEYGTNTAPFKESMLPTPVSPYSESKAKATLFCLSYYKEKHLPVVTLRPFLTYGPFQRNSMLVPYVITSLLEGKQIRTTAGEQTRDFNYVSDVVDAYVRAASSGGVAGEVINVGSGTEHMVKDVIRKIVSFSGLRSDIDCSLPYREGEVMHFYSDNSKAKYLLGWAPKVSLDDGLKRTIQWYMSMFKVGELHKWT